MIWIRFHTVLSYLSISSLQGERTIPLLLRVPPLLLSYMHKALGQRQSLVRPLQRGERRVSHAVSCHMLMLKSVERVMLVIRLMKHRVVAGLKAGGLLVQCITCTYRYIICVSTSLFSCHLHLPICRCTQVTPFLFSISLFPLTPVVGTHLPAIFFQNIPSCAAPPRLPPRGGTLHRGAVEGICAMLQVPSRRVGNDSSFHVVRACRDQVRSDYKPIDVGSGAIRASGAIGEGAAGAIGRGHLLGLFLVTLLLFTRGFATCGSPSASPRPSTAAQFYEVRLCFSPAPHVLSPLVFHRFPQLFFILVLQLPPLDLLGFASLESVLLIRSFAELISTSSLRAAGDRIGTHRAF